MFGFNKNKKDKENIQPEDTQKEQESGLAIDDILGNETEDETYEDTQDYKDVPDNDDDDDIDGIINDMLKDEPEEPLEGTDTGADKNVKKKKSSGKLSSLFRKKKNKDVENDEEPEFPPEEEAEDNDAGDSLDGLKINSINQIDRMANSSPDKNDGKGRKIMMIIFGVAFIILITVAVLMILPKNTSPAPAPVEPTPPIEEAGPTIEVTDSTVNELTQSGVVKRVIKNKLLINQANSNVGSLYFISDKADEDSISKLKIGDYIEYKYVINDSKNEIVSYKPVLKAKVASMYEDVVVLDTGDGDSKMTYDKSLLHTFQQISEGDTIEYTLQSKNVIGSIINIETADSKNSISGTPSFVNKDGDIKIETDLFIDDTWDEELKSIENKTPNPDFMIKTESDFENNSVKFYNGYTDPIWIRFAWKINEYTPSVPNVHDVGVSLVMPNGQIISEENIKEFGRMWIDGAIINFAIEKPVAGEWTLKADKEIGFNLGETKFMLMKLTGYITVERFGINKLDDGMLDLIWTIGGVEDENYEISISFVSDKFVSKVYSASSKTKDLKLTDHVEINGKSIPKGTYDIIIKVQDLDIYTSEEAAKMTEVNEKAQDGITIGIDDVELTGDIENEHKRIVAAQTIYHEYNAGTITIS